MQDYRHKIQTYSDSLKNLDSDSADFAKATQKILQHKDALLAVATDEWAAADRLALTILGKSCCYTEYLSRSPNNPSLEFAFTLLSLNRGASSPSQRIQKMIGLLSEYSNPECQLVVLQEICNMLREKSDGVDFSVLLPTILRTIATILHRYLNAKKQKASSDKDKLENQIRLEQNCEVWVKDILIKFTVTIGQLIGKQQRRTFFLRYCCDIVEALLRNKLDSVLLPQILDDVLKATVGEVLKRYSLGELIDTHSSLLKTTISYEHVDKSVEVPEKYKQDSPINSAGLTYLLSVYLEQPACQQLYTSGILTRALILAVGQSILKPYTYKLQLLERLARKFKEVRVIKPRSDLEFEYPISTLYSRLLSFNHSLPQQSIAVNDILTAIQITPEIAKKVLASSRNVNTTQHLVERICRSGQINSWTVFLRSLIDKHDFPTNSSTKELISKTLGIPKSSALSLDGA